MDSQPNSEFGNKIEEGFSRPHFIPKLLILLANVSVSSRVLQ